MARPDGDPTEEPTPQRQLKARQRGEVGVSRDLSAALGFVALVGVLVAAAPAGVARVVKFFQQSFATATGGLTTASAAGNVALQVFVSTLALPLFAAMGVAVLVGAIQTGGLFSWKAASSDFARLSPAAGLKRVFGPRMLVEMAKGLLKVSIVLAVAVTSIGWAARELPRLAGAHPGSVLAALGLVAERLGVRVALALVALGTMDWLLARRRHHRSLMMTRDEETREYKESEGDPQHR
ncbi:MAG: EscU/YscU/HrcU family type III secretion system export apparatus switch protein, partial [Deltaproteobacteria bacterium]|nr:EscU/YscU/HrcU family type III secretion system export apparatus switch protein [Deltaproteobacteria bacterium]